MNNLSKPEVKENVIAGIGGAFLFSLAGGAVWFGLYMVGFIAAISGIVGVICAFKGYSIFAKKESMKGLVISTVMALIVIVAAWYLCLSYDVYQAYQDWYELGEVDFTLTYSESVQVAFRFLEEPEIARGYLADLAMGVIFCIIGAGSYIVNMAKKIKANSAAAAVTAVGSAEQAEVIAKSTEAEVIAEPTEATEDAPASEESQSAE